MSNVTSILNRRRPPAQQRQAIPRSGLFDNSCIGPRLIRAIWTCGDALCAHLESERSLDDMDTRALVDGNALMLERRLAKAREASSEWHMDATGTHREAWSLSLQVAMDSAAEFARRLRQLLADFDAEGDPTGDLLYDLAAVSVEMMTMDHAQRFVARLPGAAS